jgi:hypothetical protein
MEGDAMACFGMSLSGASLLGFEDVDDASFFDSHPDPEALENSSASCSGRTLRTCGRRRGIRIAMLRAKSGIIFSSSVIIVQHVN